MAKISENQLQATETGKEKIIKLLQDNHYEHMTFDTLFGVKLGHTITITPHGITINNGCDLADFDQLDNDTLINLAYEVEQKIKREKINN